MYYMYYFIVIITIHFYGGKKMKVWNDPKMEMLNIEATAGGGNSETIPDNDYISVPDPKRKDHTLYYRGYVPVSGE